MYYVTLLAVALVQGVEAISFAAGRSLMSKLIAKEDQGIVHVTF